MKLGSLIATLALIAVMAFGVTAFAQTTGTMPVLYNAAGQAVNTSGGTLVAGYYYLTPSGTQQIYYYGDGTYYNSGSMSYGGNVSNPTGAAGTYIVNGVNPGLQVPNTGVGGSASFNWLALILSALVAGTGIMYLSRERTMRSTDDVQQLG